jgi:hypothetical protein
MRRDLSNRRGEVDFDLGQVMLELRLEENET